MAFIWFYAVLCFRNEFNPMVYIGWSWEIFKDFYQVLMSLDFKYLRSEIRLCPGFWIYDSPESNWGDSKNKHRMVFRPNAVMLLFQKIKVAPLPISPLNSSFAYYKSKKWYNKTAAPNQIDFISNICFFGSSAHKNGVNLRLIIAFVWRPTLNSLLRRTFRQKTNNRRNDRQTVIRSGTAQFRWWRSKDYDKTDTHRSFTHWHHWVPSNV